MTCELLYHLDTINSILKSYLEPPSPFGLLQLVQVVPGGGWSSPWYPNSGTPNPVARLSRITRFIPADTPGEEHSQHRGSCTVLCTGRHAKARAVCLHPRKQSSWNENAIPQPDTAPNPAGFLATICVLGAQSRAWIMQQTGRSKCIACTGDAATPSLPAGSLGGTRLLQAWLKLGSLLEERTVFSLF